MNKYAIKVKKPDGSSSIFSNKFESKKLAEEFAERSNKMFPGYIHEVISVH